MRWRGPWSIRCPENSWSAATASVPLEARATGAAYDAYLEGRFFWNKRTESDTRKAIQFFERAIQLDPAYAEAWAGLADGHVVLPFYSLVATGEAHPRAREALEPCFGTEARPQYRPRHARIRADDRLAMGSVGT